MISETISNHNTQCPQMCGLVHFQPITFTFPQMGQWVRLRQVMLRVTTPLWDALVHLLFSLKTLSWQNALTLFQAFPIMSPSSLYSPFLSKTKLHLQWSKESPMCVKINMLEPLELLSMKSISYQFLLFLFLFFLRGWWYQPQFSVLSIGNPKHCCRSTR